MPNAGPTEYNAIFHPALDDAAIGHKRIGNGGGKTVFHRDLILHAGVNGTVHGEQSAAHRGVQQTHRDLKVGLHAVGRPAKTVIPIAVDGQFPPFLDQAGIHKGILIQAGSFGHQLNEQFPVDDIHIIEHQVAFAAAGGFQQAAVLSGGNHDRAVSVLRADKGNACFMRNVILQDIGKIDTADDIAIRNSDVIGAGALQIAQKAGHRFQRTAAVTGAAGGGIGREIGNAAPLAGKIPLLTGADVFHQRVIVVLHNQGDRIHPGVGHAGKDQVDEAVTAGKGH